MIKSVNGFGKTEMPEVGISFMTEVARSLNAGSFLSLYKRNSPALKSIEVFASSLLYQYQKKFTK